MARKFLDDNFLLYSPTAERLYFDYAKDMPVIDYHNHLSPQQIVENTQFENITQVWLYGDHYKWRAMRTHGIDESYCTGNKTDWQKFEKWGATVPYTLRNPLYHWTHLELQRYFGVEELLSPSSAKHIYDACNEKLQSEEYRVNGLLQKMNVELLCTTDDPLDSLEFHADKNSSQPEFGTMLPAFRPDKFILIQNPLFISYIEKLSGLTISKITSYESLMKALKTRAEFFHSKGCLVADHGLEYICADNYTAEEIETIFQKAMSGQALSRIEATKYMSAILIDLGKMYHHFGWVQQFHLGALRNNNLRALRTLGPDTGWDSIGDWSQACALSLFLGRLDEENTLTKTIIYPLNPADNEVMATMIGNFNDGSIRGKVQFGSSWWFLDQKDGMEKQINALSNMGLLSCFIGMLTDSRSFLSFPRHEYFRRILCNIFGNEIKKGELPNDIEWTGKIIQDICYYNVKNYLLA
ncbi:MAG: glucuronate isomerase [Saprospiraceae bacterium]|jgi:glucuronate isomerase|nr:glucuronate isomerase [Saprospiraceae bacterium]